ncbi:MAG: ATP-binding protein, partial [Desulfuromonadales bacterium]|nr:ATP-binding protein [Desulfuromonadales bacterium]
AMVPLLSILGPVYIALRDGSTLTVDEVDASMHTKLSKRLLKLFNNKKTNPNGAQLIFATHDTNLLCKGYIRRDEVWFTEKDAGGATHIYPLTQYRVRKEDNLEKGYIAGRFGGVPFDDGLDDLFHRFEEEA